ncbi:outer membrane beta-barrel protein [Marinomonas transparens]|uniref:Outer membrane beta-barrel protein n=1 Tax=Marinomonas transparens TaxID=2795388 RepID=A0A934MY89_9GAMM|nr:outer membrane beta-barrel protein [Marinomonas transparens]MBJ7536200.1 outer membrane beta-barrel protein [Marinomonas transparens]
MKTMLINTVLIMGLSVSSFSFAEIHAQIGAGSRGSDIKNNSSSYDGDFTAPVFSARLLPSNHFVIETNYYFAGGGKFSQDSNPTSNPSNFETSGLELNLLLSTDMVSDGFYAYAGIGYFSERWKSITSGNKYNASGLQVPVGVGYNFGNFSADLQYAYREPDAYKGEIFDTDSDPEASIYQFRLLTNF